MGLEKGIDLYKVLIGPFENPGTEASRVSFLPLKTQCEERAFLFSRVMFILPSQALQYLSSASFGNYLLGFFFLILPPPVMF